MSTFYVGKSGNNGNSCGTAQSPTSTNRKLTIADGIACLSSKDTLIIGDGTYNERISSHNGVHIPSGDATGDTIIRAENALGAILKPDAAILADGWFYVVEIAEARSYITFDGLVTDGSLQDGPCYTFASQTIGEYLTHITVKNGIAHDCGFNGSLGIGLGSHYNSGFDGNFTVQNMEIYGQTVIIPPCYGGYGIYVASPNNLIENNIIHDNHTYGIHMYEDDYVVDNNIIRNNTIYNIGLEDGCYDAILVSQGTNNKIYNNVLYNNQNGIRIGYTANATLVYHNSIDHSIEYGIVIDPSFGAPTNTVVRNNIADNSGSGPFSDGGTSTTQDHNIFGPDPFYVDPTGGNLHLSTISSPAIGAGLDLGSSYNTDKDGVSRPQGANGLWDCGAYEFFTPVAGQLLLTIQDNLNAQIIQIVNF